MAVRTLCDGCDGSGIRAPAQPSCKIEGERAPWIAVERCDTCDRYPDDLTAALSQFKVAAWFQCSDGGFHALADSGTRRLARHAAQSVKGRRAFSG
jgi:hypothetical protein